MNEIALSQKQLSERLLLLHECSSRNILISFHVAPNHRAEAKRNLGLLDTIAACLTTGQPGDVVATAFDGREDLGVVLAKAGPVLPSDVEAVDRFTGILKTATAWNDAIPFLEQRCKPMLLKRIRKLHQSLEGIYGKLREMADPDVYSFKSMDEEFGGNRENVDRILQVHSEPTAPDFLTLVLDACLSMSNPELTIGMDGKAFQDYFQNFVDIASMIYRCRFISSLADSKFSNYKLSKEFFKFRRHLEKACHYTNLRDLITCREKTGHVVTFQWLQDNEHLGGTTVGTIKLAAKPVRVVAKVFSDLGKKLRPGYKRYFRKDYPELEGNWAHHRVVQPCIHPELRIIHHLGPHIKKGTSPGQHPLYIGCTKRCCLCCVLWLRCFNEEMQVSWMTSSAHGKVYPNWALLAAENGPNDGVVKDWHCFDKSVIRFISRELIFEFIGLTEDDGSEPEDYF